VNRRILLAFSISKHPPSYGTNARNPHQYTERFDLVLVNGTPVVEQIVRHISQ